MHTCVSVPPAPVNHDGLSPLGHDDVGATWEFGRVNAVADADGADSLPHGQFGGGVLRLHRRHDLRTLGFGDPVSHKWSEIVRSPVRSSPRVGTVDPTASQVDSVFLSRREVDCWQDRMIAIASRSDSAR